MLRVDGRVIAPRLARIVRSIEVIEEGRPADVGRLEAEGFERVRDSLEYRLLTAAQALIDVTAHITSAMRYEAPETAADGVRELGRRGVIPPGLAERLIDVVGMRNVLVHEYLAVDSGQVLAALHDLEPLRSFVVHVNAWMREHGA